ncbi:heterokaryon incompatibility protein-domain-containing protein [Pestalotiopsis sp. NC0098]|nr:heterokaryon incompatibility protein-domain-containing protein [Pestalotiopsis sp. NC0098]
MFYTQNLAVSNAAGGENIRLFKILDRGSERGQTMECEVQMFPLTQSPQYVALSYCWRIGDESESIRFTGSLQGIKNVSRDLMSALWALHSYYNSKWLWVDAICIDQSRNSEKNDQVPRMQMIYESAHRVIVWLGESNPHYEASHKYYGGRPEERIGLFTRGQVNQLCDEATGGRGWWSRIWIVQEMMVAKYLFVCIGSQLLRWDEFAHDALQWHAVIYQGLLKATDLRRRIKRLDLLRRDWWKTKHSLDLLQLLDIGRESFATDAKDNIYGLLGLMKPEDQERIHVDYNCKTDHLYAETTAMLIEREQSLNFLVVAFSYKSSQSQPSLPSWVLDFGGCQRDSQSSEVRRLTKYKFREIEDDKIRHQASADTRPLVCFHASSLKLGVEAVVFDSVVASTITIPGFWGSYRQSESEQIESGREWIRSAVKVLEASLQTRPLPSDPRSYLFQTDDIRRLLFDFFSSNPVLIPEPEIPMDVDHDPARIKYDVEGSAESNQLLDWFDIATTENYSLHDIFGFCQEYALFTTTSGFVGVAEYDRRTRELWGGKEENQSACSEDTIVIPLGSSKPWLLRKTEADGEYRLVVDCVIPEIMSGEVMKLVEEKKMETQWVTLV